MDFKWWKEVFWIEKAQQPHVMETIQVQTVNTQNR